MNLQIDICQEDCVLFSKVIEKADNKLSDKLYSLLKKPTMVFMTNETYALLSPKIKETLNTLENEDEMSIADMLNNDVLTILIDELFEPYNDMMLFVDEYTNKSNKYLVITKY